MSEIPNLTPDPKTLRQHKDLADAGWVPGDYMFRCIDCSSESMGGKTARRCRGCAERRVVNEVDQQPQLPSSNPVDPKPSDERNGCFLDKMWCCKVCDGEIPDGHTENCDIWKLEKKHRDFIAKEYSAALTERDRLRADLERLSIGSRGNVWDEVRALRSALNNIRDFRCSSFRTYQQDRDDMQAIARGALSVEYPSSVETADDSSAFKNFHRLLCERFGYGHDEKDWRRDQLSLIEHIASQKPQRSQDERTLRLLLAMAYSGIQNLYTDDGELQDGSEVPVIDYKRDPVEDIRRKIHQRGAAKVASSVKASACPCRCHTSSGIGGGRCIYCGHSPENG